MRPSLARLSRAGFAVFAVACFTASLAPSPARAAHWLVDQNGGGDFTTIQQAIDAWANGLGARESILVMPGEYPETIVITPWSTWVLASVEGPHNTAVNSVSFSGSSPTPSRLEDLTFTQLVELNAYAEQALFTRCVFAGNIHGAFGSSPPVFEDCDFYGRAAFLAVENHGGPPPFRSLRFHGAPVRVSTTSGDVLWENCSFEGPADTLMYVEWADSDDPLYLLGCRFGNARLGLVSESPFGIRVVSCTFEDVSEAAVRVEPQQAWSVGMFAGSRIEDSRFVRCQTAIYWRPAATTGLYQYGVSLTLDRDTVLACGGDALVLGPLHWLELDNCLIEDSGGRGGVFQLDRLADSTRLEPGYAVVRNSHFTNNHAGGVILEDTPARMRGWGSIDFCSFVRNGGPGLRVSCGAWSVAHSIALANGGDGFSLDTPAPGYPTLLAFNTSVLNQGDGVRLTGPVHPGDSLHVVQHNLSALNAGTGFRVPHQSFGSFAFNDAWGNYQSQYAGAWGSADSNLTVDPRFCDLGAGDLGLQQGSPCGAGGIYGLIGALPEQCPNTTAVETTAPRISFAVRPSVARGSVEFVPPTAGPEGRIELFDLSGRRLWGAAFGPRTGTLRWRGESDTGHAPPGLYWVRFTRAGEGQARRLIWLE